MPGTKDYRRPDSLASTGDVHTCLPGTVRFHETVEECDPEFSPEVAQAWEQMMGIGIDYMLRRYHHS